MPELPEVETVRRGLEPVMEGALIVSVEARRPDLRFPLPSNFASALTGRRILSVGRRAKYLMITVEDGPLLICHLGMSGSFRIETDDDPSTPGVFHHERSKAPGARPRRVSPGVARRSALSRDVQRSQAVRLHALSEQPGSVHQCWPTSAWSRPATRWTAPCWQACSAQEDTAEGSPARPDDDRRAGQHLCSRSAVARGPVAMRAAGAIARANGKPTAKAEKLAEAVRDVIADAMPPAAPRCGTMFTPMASLGYFQHSFAVYDREGEPCPKPGCRGIIARVTQSGRSTFYCPVCQR